MWEISVPRMLWFFPGLLRGVILTSIDCTLTNVPVGSQITHLPPAPKMSVGVAELWHKNLSVTKYLNFDSVIFLRHLCLSRSSWGWGAWRTYRSIAWEREASSGSQIWLWWTPITYCLSSLVPPCGSQLNLEQIQRNCLRQTCRQWSIFSVPCQSASYHLPSIFLG